MDTHLLALYVPAVFLAMIAPGPDMMFILATGARGSARAGLLATLGVAASPSNADKTRTTHKHYS